MYLGLGCVKLQQDSMLGGLHFSKVNPLNSFPLCALIDLKGQGYGGIRQGLALSSIHGEMFWCNEVSYCA